MQGATSQDLRNSATAPMNEPAAHRSQGHNNLTSGQAQSQNQNQSRGIKKSKQVCRFYGTKKGCRAQDQCPYLHVQSDNNTPTSLEHVTNEKEPRKGENGSQSASGNVQQPAQGLDTTDQNAVSGRDIGALARRRAVPKPVSIQQQKDPREFQLTQVVRRFSSTRDDRQDKAVLSFKLRPSDPDFPFELDALECILTVPTSYPKGGRPAIRVENKDIPRGFQINIEKGFDTLSADHPEKTLLQLLNDLDRNLEKFLTAEKAQTIKIVANRRPIDDPKDGTRSSAQEPVPLSDTSIAPKETTQQPIRSAQAKADARAKREIEVRQLEARMNRVPLFAKSNDGISFNIPLQVTKPSKLPLSLQSLKEATLIVPVLYGLEPCRIRLKGVNGTEAENAEVAFEKRANDHKDMTLMAHINYLSQNIHAMSTMAVSKHVQEPEQPAPSSGIKLPLAEAEQSNTPGLPGVVDEDRPHLRFVSHPPPEWNRVNHDEISESESSDYDTSDTDEGDSDASHGAESQAGGAILQTPVSKPSLEKGVLFSFPHLELHGVELLEVYSLSISVKCDRCKTVLDVKNVKPAEPDTTLIRTESCQKCASPIAVSFRSEPMHTNSIKAGYLDLEGCTVVDMLLSQFLPTCSECSTTVPSPGIASVRGDSPLSVCRECHHRLNFKIPEVKFLRVASNDPRLHLPLRSKSKKENLGISAGTELPDRGRCKHYAKSYRWFRFSCCGRVYPCDRCHDEKEDHPNEHGNRMICGWCSREQNYRPEDCNVCGRSVIRKTGGGFWEGGKGTRDKVKMNRKDPRKYKRIGGGS